MENWGTAWDRIKESIAFSNRMLNKIDWDAIDFIAEYKMSCALATQQFLLGFLFNTKGMTQSQIAKFASVSTATSYRWFNMLETGEHSLIEGVSLDHIARQASLRFADFDDIEPSRSQVHLGGIQVLINRARLTWFSGTPLLCKEYFIERNLLGLLQCLIDKKVIRLMTVPLDASAFARIVRRYRFSRELNCDRIADYFHDWFGPYQVVRLAAEGLFDRGLIPYPAKK